MLNSICHFWAHRTTLSKSLCRASQSMLSLTSLNILVSSANFNILLAIPWSKSLIKTRNKTGHNTEPCGTPLQTLIHPDHLPLIDTRCLLSFNQSSITFRILPLMPCFCTLSNALARSKNTTSTLWPSSTLCKTLSKNSRVLVRQELPFLRLKPCCESYKLTNLKKFNNLVSSNRFKHLRQLTH